MRPPEALRRFEICLEGDFNLQWENRTQKHRKWDKSVRTYSFRLGLVQFGQ